MIRKDARWTEMPDERILGSLRDYGPSSPSIMSVSKGIEGSEEEIHSRCKRLALAGLIIPISGGYVKITKYGEAYLNGGIDLTEIILQAGPGTGKTSLFSSSIAPAGAMDYAEELLAEG